MKPQNTVYYRTNKRTKAAPPASQQSSQPSRDGHPLHGFEGEINFRLGSFILIFYPLGRPRTQ